MQQEMSCEHHDEIHYGQDQEHLVDAALPQIVQHSLHDRACNGLCGTEACHGKSCGQAFPVLEPEHQCLNGRQIACTQSDTHNKSVTQIDANQRQCASFMQTAIVNKNPVPAIPADWASGVSSRK